MNRKTQGMKHSLTALAAGGALLMSAAASADILSVEAEVQYWQSKPSGGHTPSVSTLPGGVDLDTDSREYFWSSSGQGRLGLSLYHFIPLVPNIKVETQELSFNARRDIVTIGGTPEIVDIDLGHETYTLFYAPLDNGLTEFKFGASLKQFDGHINEMRDSDTSAMWRIKEDILSGYARGSVSLPFTGFSVIAQGHVGVGSHDFHDVEAAIRYRFVDSMMLDGHVSLGYRSMKLHFDNETSVNTQHEFKGPFLNLALRF
jgi:outer membrane protein